MQWQNMAVPEYKNVKIAKSQNPHNISGAKCDLNVKYSHKFEDA